MLGKGIDGGPSGETFCTNMCQSEHRELYHEASLRGSGASVVVASVDYRLAPEDPFPAAVEGPSGHVRTTSCAYPPL